MFSNSREIMSFIKAEKVAMVDFKFVDLPGRWHHITVPVSSLDDALLRNGIPFDSSSVPGFRGKTCADMSLIPDITTGFLDPFTEFATLSFICAICEADTKEGISGDPRSAAIRAEKYLKQKLGAESKWLPEIEFYLFNSADYGTDRNYGYFSFESEETDPTGSGFANRPRAGYHALPPLDTGNDIRSEIVSIVEKLGVRVRYHHHEVGPFGQNEIEIVPTPLVKAGDAVMLLKYVIRLVAQRNGLVATFLPKPLFNEPGNGMHFHQFLIKNDKSLFWDAKGEHAHLSNIALSYIAGILDHAPSIVGITNPSTNSYRRLVPGFEAPTKRFFGLANRCAAIRVPKYDDTPELKRIEFRTPDATCNPYLAICAQLLAGLDGIERKLDPVALGFGPFNDDIEKWSDAKRAKIKDIPTGLDAALDALTKDRDYLIKGKVFDAETIARHTDDARAIANEISRYPVPKEIEEYFDL